MRLKTMLSFKIEVKMARVCLHNTPYLVNTA